ncbi:hypothetical protein PVAP13_7NG155200 [Panicum virgatum]|uniref:PGG domain-containing protein n=1 Tax=Panicum virgatum TaxID=38727 RepID=A0A8T0PWB3_PANVG|nr:hypothetical protein PVAP13_7NG155200 [Panicum virgatum]
MERTSPCATSSANELARDMATIMADQPEKKPAPVVPKHPELLMAAREGDPVRLSILLDEPVVAWTAIDIQDGDGGGNPVRHAEAVTSGLDSILHVVASGGDGDQFLEGASVIHSKARHLLDAGNSEGDTPLHCAARAGRIEMVSKLIRLARAEAGDERVKAALRKQNRQRETALHEAVRLADREMVERLMSADPQLARLPEVDGASPLYLAVSLGHDVIAELLHSKDQGLSYCGPDGQNVWHAAVLHNNTHMLMQWGKHELIKQGDRAHGSTPLHSAASRGVPGTVMALLEADKSSAYQYDNEGLLPIHVAAMENKGDVVRVFLDECPGCAEAQDARGRTFLHVAVASRNSTLVLNAYRYFRGHRRHGAERFETIMNMRDGYGNTGLHLAVKTRSVEIFYYLLWNKGIQLNFRDNMGRTALDILEKPVGFNFWLDPRLMMWSLLEAAGAEYGDHHNGFPHLDEEKEAKMISDSIPTVGIISALLVTISFAAAFAIPGGYRAGDDTKSGSSPGTPVLAKTYSFQGFVVANNLALLCSALATISLAYAGVTNVDIRTRMATFGLSIFFLHGSARSLAAAFAFGTYAALAPVARAISVLTWLGMSFSSLDVAWLACTLAVVQLLLLKRLGARAWLRVAAVILVLSVWALWPYIIILGLLAYYKTHGGIH